MTDITTYPMIDDFDTTLAQSWDGAVGTVYLNEAVGITLPASTTTYIVVNPWKSTMQVAKINAVNNTLKTATVSSITVDKGAWVAYTQQSHPVGSVVRISTNYAFWKDIIDSVNTKVNTNDDDIAQGKFADATARDAYFTSPVNGNSAYLTAEGKWTDYIAWAWADRDVGTVTANASTTVAGKVEIATQAEFDAWTATGGTWAILVATTDQSRKQINTATAKSTPVNADSIGIADSAASGVIKKTTLTELKAASDMQATTTTSWFVEMATDEEALAGSDETRYINSKQAKDNYLMLVNVVTGSRNWAGNESIAHWLGKTPKMVFAYWGSANYTWQGFYWDWAQWWNWIANAWRGYSSSYMIFTNWANDAQVTSIDSTNLNVTRTDLWEWTFYSLVFMA